MIPGGGVDPVVSGVAVRLPMRQRGASNTCPGSSGPLETVSSPEACSRPRPSKSPDGLFSRCREGRRRTGPGSRMARVRNAGLVLAWFFGLLAGGTQAATHVERVETESPDIRVTLRLPIHPLPQSGWVPVGFQVVNRTDEALSYRWSLGGSSRNSNRSGSGQFSCPPRSTSIDWQMVQSSIVLGAATGYLNLSVYGSGMSEDTRWLETASAMHPMKSGSLGLCDLLEAENKSQLEAKRSPASSSSGNSISIINFQEVPGDWRAFSGLNTIIGSSDSLRGVTTEVRAALRTWIATGGDLVVATVDSEVDLGPGFPAAAHGKWTSHGLGRVALVRLVASEVGKPPLRISHSDSEWIVESQNRQSTAVYPPTVEVFPSDPVPWLLIGIMVCLLALLMGPVNLFFFAPLKNRHRLFWTLPASSLFGLVLIFCAILWIDGIGGVGRRATRLVLLPDENLAFLRQTQVAKTGLIRSQALTVPREIAASFVTDTSGRQSEGTLRRDGDVLTGDWFPSRSTLHHRLEGVLPFRGGLVVSKAADGTLQVQSTFPARLHEILLRTEQGLMVAEVLDPGEVAVLTPAAPGAENPALDTPGKYRCLLDSLEGMPLPTHTGIDWEPSRIEVFGAVRNWQADSLEGRRL